jgi:hypothetical protein
MSLEDQANEEADRIADQLENGEITQAEYSRYMRELRNDYAQYESEGY